MSKKEIVEALRKELDGWRTRLEELRVKASLGKLELRDKEREAFERFEGAYETAMRKLGEARDEADDRATALRAGVEAGWKELRATYKSVREGRGKPG
jgi:hypothetical protein